MPRVGEAHGELEQVGDVERWDRRRRAGSDRPAARRLAPRPRPSSSVRKRCSGPSTSSATTRGRELGGRRRDQRQVGALRGELCAGLEIEHHEADLGARGAARDRGAQGDRVHLERERRQRQWRGRSLLPEIVVSARTSPSARDGAAGTTAWTSAATSPACGARTPASTATWPASGATATIGAGGGGLGAGPGSPAQAATSRSALSPARRRPGSRSIEVARV